MVVAFSAANLHVIWFKTFFVFFFPMTILNLFSAAGVGQDMLCSNQPSTWNHRVDSNRERRRPWGVMDISVWYRLFLCGQIHHKLTDVRRSVSWSCAGCDGLLRRAHTRGMSAKHIINKCDWWCHQQALKWMNLLLSSHSTAQPWAEPPTRSRPPLTYPYTSSHTQSRKTNYNSLLHLRTPRRCSDINTRTLTRTYTHRQPHLHRNT